ncbi:MAG: chemotaxis-specific protein-glutamate methyltransferase CheB [Myxococcales bacterium]|nr:chemotaxis-specific protein-glutamate methyltransferase CheB [Myxococcales bacterium]
MARLRVLIVDDSALSRQALKQVLELDPGLQVAGEAKTGEEAIALVRAMRPDLVTMDLNMPGMGGLKAIEAIIRERRLPIVVISERSSTAGVDLNYEALSRGALELVPKSMVFGAAADDARRFAERMRQLAESQTREAKPAVAPRAAETAPPHEPPAMLGIGASTGGPRSLAKVLGELPKDYPLPIAVVQHMADDFFDSFVRFLGDASGRRVIEAESGILMQPGVVYVAPPRQELFVRDSLLIRLTPAPPSARITPSVDSLFFSLASSFRARGLGVLLTGMGDDGAEGLLRMRRVGARTVVQDRASCAVFGMPKAAIEVGAAEVVLSLDEIPRYLVEATKKTSVPRPPSVPAPVPERRRVLVVDDDAQALEACKKALSDAGFEVHVSDNPLMVAGVLRRTPMDLVLLEPELRTMKGAVVMQALRTAGQATVPVFLHSRLPVAELRAKASEVGAAGFVRKGELPALVREVTSFLGGAQRPMRL